MAQTITERVYDELTHKLRQWEKLAPAPHELLGALKSWSQLGNADIEAAANAAAGLAVKATSWGGLAKELRRLASDAKGSANDPALAKRIANSIGALRPKIEAFNKAHPRLPSGSISDSSVMMYVVPLIDPKRFQEKYSMTLRDLRRNLIGSERSFIGQINLMAYQMEQGIKQDESSQPSRSVKAFANVPDVPAALAHLRTAHAALKAQVNAEHNAPPRSGGFAGVKAVTAEDAAQDMLKLSAKFEAIAQQIQAANGFGAASRLFVGARRFYQASIAKYGQFWSPDMQRIMKNTLDRVSIGAARDSSDPQWFLYHSMVTAANRARNWSSDVRRSAG